jgi:excisionase family DNA binding protein
MAWNNLQPITAIGSSTAEFGHRTCAIEWRPEEHDMSSIESENGYAPRIGRSVSLDHAAELLGVSRRTIYNRIRDGRLQTIRTLGGSQRVLMESVHSVREPLQAAADSFR